LEETLWDLISKSKGQILYQRIVNNKTFTSYAFPTSTLFVTVVDNEIANIYRIR